MTLDEFIDQTKQDAERFRAMWVAGAEGDAQSFPPEMGEGDWFDQFLLFIQEP